MRRTSLTDIHRLPDMQSKEAFNFVVGSTPGGSHDRDLHLKCSSVTFPDTHNATFVVNLWGHQVKHRGKYESAQQLNVVYFEDSLFKTTKALKAWHKAVVNPETGSSLGSKSSYGINAKLFFYDHKGNSVYENTFVNMFPEQVSGFELSGDSSSALLVNCTLAYDYITEGDANMSMLTSLGLDIASDVLGVDIAGIGLSFPDAWRNLQSMAVGTAMDTAYGIVSEGVESVTSVMGNAIGGIF